MLKKKMRGTCDNTWNMITSSCLKLVCANTKQGDQWNKIVSRNRPKYKWNFSVLKRADVPKI